MSNDFILTLISNATLLLMLCVIYTFLPFQISIKKKWHVYLSGFLIGLISITIMTFHFHLENGIFFDTRTILFSITGMFFGLIPLVISSTIGVIYRIILGGSGIIMGVFTIISSGLIGLIWHYNRHRIKRKSMLTLSFFVVSLIVHILMLSGTLLLPQNASTRVFNKIALPIIIIYPIFSVLLSILLTEQHEKIELKSNLAESKDKFETILMSTGDSIIATDKNLNITVCNKPFRILSGYDIEEIKELPIDKIFNINKPFEKYIEKIKKNHQSIKLSNNTDFIDKYNNIIPINGSISQIKGKKDQFHGLVIVIRNATKEREYQKRLNHISYHDALTGIYNRRYLEEIFKSKISNNLFPLSLILGDVNGLKLTNDSFGHYIGDRLIKETAKKIKESLPKNHILSRWGGDEFAILLYNTNNTEVSSIANKIKYACSKIKINSINFSISLGFSTIEDDRSTLRDCLVKAENMMYDNKLVESKKFKDNFIKNLLKTLHKKYPEEKKYSTQVSALCEQIGKNLEMSENEIDELKMLGYIHNIGKISLGEDIAKKIMNHEKLDDNTWDSVKKLPVLSYRILNSSNEYSHLAKYILCYHERPDGKGYPNGLTNEKIPFQAKILMVAKAYVAMKNNRPYRKKLSQEDSLKELLKNSGTQFDSSVVDTFIQSFQ